MLNTSFSRSPTRAVAVALVLLVCAARAWGADSYDTASRHLSIPAVAIGTATYANMIISVGNIVSGPSGTTPAGSVDTYNPGNNQLTVQTVTVGTATYHNVVVTVAGLVSIGSVSGADTYVGADLGVPLVQAGTSIYANVHATVSKVLSVAGGMPTAGPDTYDPAANQLAIPAVQVGGLVYTNVVISPAKVLSVGGLSSTIRQANFYSFTGGSSGISGSTDGVAPAASLVQGSDGSLYGTTSGGGTIGAGTVFSITLSGTESVLYSFTYDGLQVLDDGASPHSCLIEGGVGNFQGTTQSGGPYNAGTAFTVNQSGNESALYAFGTNGGTGSPGDALNPTSCLALGKDGNFYGTTSSGGQYKRGTVFMITPGGSEVILYSFHGNGGIVGSYDGASPAAGLVLGPDGRFYGTTYAGGQQNAGTIFSIAPAGGQPKVEYAFSGGSPVGGNGNRASGANPVGGVIFGSDGNFYGTTQHGGAYVEGTVFKVTRAGVETLLHSFAGNNGIAGSTDGALPLGGLIQASDGNFYGTTAAGGAYNGEGTVFKVTPTGVENVLHAFSGLGAIAGSQDGAYPGSSLIQASDGNLYGTTATGGAYDAGTVYRLTGAIITP